MVCFPLLPFVGFSYDKKGMVTCKRDLQRRVDDEIYDIYYLPNVKKINWENFNTSSNKLGMKLNWKTAMVKSQDLSHSRILRGMKEDAV